MVGVGFSLCFWSVFFMFLFFHLFIFVFFFIFRVAANSKKNESNDFKSWFCYLARKSKRITSPSPFLCRDSWGLFGELGLIDLTRFSLIF